MRLPTTFDLGIRLSVKRGQAVQGAKGHYDPATGEVVISSECSPLGEVAVLIHEMMHAAECGMIANGTIKRHINHEFIHAASFGAAIALARCGALDGIEQEDVDAFLREQR